MRWPGAAAPSDAVVERAIAFAQQDVHDLLPTLEERARDAIAQAEQQLAERGRQEARSLQELLERQRQRIERAEARFDDRQRELFDANEAERLQLRRDRAHWLGRLESIDRELEVEPARVHEGYQIRATRLEPVGLVYLWPVTG